MSPTGSCINPFNTSSSNAFKLRSPPVSRSSLVRFAKSSLRCTGKKMRRNGTWRTPSELMKRYEIWCTCSLSGSVWWWVQTTDSCFTLFFQTYHPLCYEDYTKVSVGLQDLVCKLLIYSDKCSYQGLADMKITTNTIKKIKIGLKSLEIGDKFVFRLWTDGSVMIDKQTWL